MNGDERTREAIALGESPVGNFLYRPGQLLVATDALESAEGVIREYHGETTSVEDDLGLAIVAIPEEFDLPAIVEEMRRRLEQPVVHLNHVFQAAMIHDDTLPQLPALPRPTRTVPPRPIDGGGRGVRVAVLDTGVKLDHPYLADRVRSRGRQDDDALDVDPDGALGPFAGHGTFVAGIVVQHAPGATVQVRSDLDVRGTGDDLALASALLSIDADVVLLPFGGYTSDDRLSPALRRALHGLSADTAIVGAAGNFASDRPFWPAAASSVLAVGAIDGEGSRALFSNYGPWVNAWATGVDVISSFVTFQGRQAPSTGSMVAFNGYAEWSGTSFAAASVAGEIARTMQPGTIPSAATASVLAMGRPFSEGGVVLQWRGR